MTTLRKVANRLIGELTNSSRHYLEAWLRDATPPGAGKEFRVLDAGAGEGMYRSLFDRVSYEAADFAGVDKPYGQIEYVCDLTAIPVGGETYDLVVCTQVLEHVPEPVAVLREFQRVLKPGGRAFVSAPLAYHEHEQPFDFFRYTQFAWRRMAEEAGLEVQELEWLEGYYGTLAYQLDVASFALDNRLLRLIFRVMSVRFARKDVERKLVDRGMCKNYRVVMSKPGC